MRYDTAGWLADVDGAQCDWRKAYEVRNRVGTAFYF